MLETIHDECSALISMQDTDGNVIDTELRFLNIGRRENYDFFDITSSWSSVTYTKLLTIFNAFLHVNVSLHLKLEVISIIEHVIAFIIFSVVSNLLNTLIDCIRGYFQVLG